MKIRRQLLSIALAGALATGLLGALALWLTERQGQALQDMRASLTAVRNAMEGDMMHDAIRGDVLRFQLGSKEEDGNAKTDAQKDFIEHAERFAKAMRELHESQRTPDVAQAIQKARQQVAAYTEAARSVLQANGDPAPLAATIRAPAALRNCLAPAATAPLGMASGAQISFGQSHFPMRWQSMPSTSTCLIGFVMQPARS